MPRTPENWLEVFKSKGRQTSLDKANALLGDLTHYRHGGANEDQDREQIVNFMEAVRLQIEEQVKIEIRTLG